jgi:hypothetical protein
VKVPLEVLEKIATLGRGVLDEDASEVDLGDDLALWLRDRQPMFALAVLNDWSRRRIKMWVQSQLGRVLGNDEDEDGQLVLPFPELHSYLEISPGTKKHQSVMNGHDWDNALAMYKNRWTNAEVQFRDLERCYHRVRPFLVEGLTTADIIDRLIPVPVG